MTNHDRPTRRPVTRRVGDPDDPTAFPLQDHLGMHIDHPEPGSATATVEVTPELLNPHGVVHGGVAFIMADTIMGTATKSLLGDARICATIEMSIHFLRPVHEGTLHAEAHVVHLGSTIAHVTAVVRDHRDRQVATASAAFAIIGPEADETEADERTAEEAAAEEAAGRGQAPTRLPEGGGER